MKASARQALATAIGLGIACLPNEAQAWVDTHLVGDDVRVELEPSGTAVVEHIVRLKVQGGPLRWLDIPGVDRDATPLPDATVTADSKEDPAKAPSPLTVSVRPDGALRLNIDAPKGVSRGLFVFRARYRTHLLEHDRIERDGAMLRIRWAGPSWAEGLDNARCTFVFPSAPTEPRVWHGSGAGSLGPTGAVAAGELGAFLSTLRRGRDIDELELVRPHVARGEVVTWTAYADPKMLSTTDERASTETTAAAPANENAPTSQARTWLISLLLVAFSALAGCKAYSVALSARHAGLRPRPLLPIGAILRTTLAGPVLAGGVALQLMLNEAWLGTALILLAMALTAYLPPLWRPAPRGPGQWFALRDGGAFEQLPRDWRTGWLDVSTPVGKVVVAALAAIVGIVAFGMGHRSPYETHLLVFDSLALVPILCTGRRSDLPPNGFRAPAQRLARIAQHLRAKGLRAVAWARWSKGDQAFDELRLLVAPRLPRPGLSAIEIGYAAARGMGGTYLMPEVLVRAVEGTNAHEALSAMLRGQRWTRGRKLDERVLSVRPRIPTVACVAALAARLAACARDLEAAPYPSTPNSASAPPSTDRMVPRTPSKQGPTIPRRAFTRTMAQVTGRPSGRSAAALPHAMPPALFRASTSQSTAQTLPGPIELASMSLSAETLPRVASPAHVPADAAGLGLVTMPNGWVPS